MVSSAGFLGLVVSTIYTSAMQQMLAVQNVHVIAVVCGAHRTICRDFANVSIAFQLPRDLQAWVSPAIILESASVWSLDMSFFNCNYFLGLLGITGMAWL